MSRKPEYKASNEAITKEINALNENLKQNHYGKDTRRIYCNYATAFLNWLEEEKNKPEECTYNDIIVFTNHCHKTGKSRKQVNTTLLAIRHYYSYLREEKGVKHNPASGIFIRGTSRRIPHDIIEKEELEKLYQTCEASNLRTQRNKAMLGLIVYQGITTEELHKLEAIHLKLREGKIEIPGSNNSNGRILKLEPHQIIELYEYLNEIRPKLLQEIHAYKPGRKPDKVKAIESITQLFISLNGSEAIKNSLKYLIADLKKINPEIKSARQIRSSVITHWLKEKDIRTVQYMAGHRYVSSTERYQAGNLEGLQEQLSKHHPLSQPE